MRKIKSPNSFRVAVLQQTQTSDLHVEGGQLKDSFPIVGSIRYHIIIKVSIYGAIFLLMAARCDVRLRLWLGELRIVLHIKWLIFPDPGDK